MTAGMLAHGRLMVAQHLHIVFAAHALGGGWACAL